MLSPPPLVRRPAPSLAVAGALLLATIAAVAGCGGPRGGLQSAGAGFGADGPATTGVVEGEVRDRASGALVSFATVVLTPLGDDARDASVLSATTDGKGTFRMDALEPGRYRVLARYASLRTEPQEIEVTAGASARLQLELAPGPTAAAATAIAADTPEAAAARGHGAIAGIVTDQATGEPIEGAVVAATTPALRDAQMAVTDETGSYRLLGLPAGTYTV